ncbi:MAG: hypothetical protein JJU02_10585 [Cryomorphaceae bacterium]|nr:hypothetical protein [Cryomorphaceae bacterium]
MDKNVYISNGITVNLLKILGLLLIAFLLIILILGSIPGTLGIEIDNYWYWMVLVIAILGYFILRTRRVDFKVDYEIIHMVDRPLLRSVKISSYYGSSEFPKRSVLSYQLEKKGFRKIVSITTSSASQQTRTRKLDVTFLSGGNIRKLTRCLDMIIQKNEKRKGQ